VVELEFGFCVRPWGSSFVPAVGLLSLVHPARCSILSRSRARALSLYTHCFFHWCAPLAAPSQQFHEPCAQTLSRSRARTQSLSLPHAHTLSLHALMEGAKVNYRRATRGYCVGDDGPETLAVTNLREKRSRSRTCVRGTLAVTNLRERNRILALLVTNLRKRRRLSSLLVM